MTYERSFQPSESGHKNKNFVPGYRHSYTASGSVRKYNDERTVRYTL